MFNWLKQPHAGQTDSAGLRELLFGDAPLSTWAGTSDIEPWTTFRTAAAALDRGDADAAKAALSSVLRLPSLESRHYVQAWTGLRALGLQPSPAEAKHLYGVVLDVPVGSGLDTLAAYEDGTARYLNHANGAIVWNAVGTDTAMDGLVNAVLATGRTVVEVIGPWRGARPALPKGQARLSLLTASGLHFGQAPIAALTGDRLAGAVFRAGTALMTALVARGLAKT